MSDDPPGELLGSGESDGLNGHGDCAKEGNPVNILSRNKYQREVDFVGPGRLPLKIVRSYNSHSAASQPTLHHEFGRGWSGGFGDKIVAITPPEPSLPSHSVLIQTESGYRFSLSTDGDGVWETTSGRTLSFSYDVDRDLYLWIDEGIKKTFSGNGELLMESNEFGESLTYHYVSNSSPALLERINHSFGGHLTFTYNHLNRITAITGALGEQYRYSYNNFGMLESAERPKTEGSETVNYDYGTLTSTLSLLQSISYPEGGGLYAEFEYSPDRKAKRTQHVTSGIAVEGVDFLELQNSPQIKVQTTNPNNKQTVYIYEEIAGLQRLVKVDGIAIGSCAASNSHYTYDAYGFYDKITDEEGNITDYDYSRDGQLTAITTGFGTSEARTTTTESHSIWMKPTSVSTALLDVSFEIEELTGRVLEIRQTNKAPHGIPGQQRVSTITYENYPDSLNVKKMTIDGPRNDVDDHTFYDFDTSGRLVKIAQRVSSGISLTTEFGNFDAYGRARRVTTPAGMIENRVYDLNGRLLSSSRTIDGHVRTIQFAYNGAGDLETVTFPDGVVENYSYDSARRLKSVIRGELAVVGDTAQSRHFAYDEASNITGESRMDKAYTWFPNPYCPQGGGFGFGNGGQCSPGWYMETAELRYSMSYEYDELNRLVKQVWDNDERDRKYTYRKDNRLASSMDGYDQVTSYGYTANSEPDDTTFRDGGISEVSYDEDGRIDGVRDALGQWTYYHRDGFGDTWRVISPATGTTDYEYDLAGNLTKKTDARGVVLNHNYDALGRLTETTVGTSSTPIHTFEYDTDQPGYLYRVVDEAGTHTFVRDEEGRVTSRTDTLSGMTLTTSTTYDVYGRMDTMTYPSGLVVDYDYDTFGQIESISASGGGLSSSTVIDGISHYPFGPIRHFTYGNGEERSQTLDINYELSWLMSGLHANRTFTRDLNGNIESFDNRSYEYDLMDRLDRHTGPDGTYEYDYDLNGNREWHKRNGVLTNYSYNASKTRLNALSGGISEPRSYDANGNTVQIGNRYFDHNDLNRLWRYREGSLTVTYAHNAFGERQLKQQGSTTTRFVYNGPNLLHEQVGTTKRDYIYLAGEPVGLVKNGSLYYIHNDHLGRPEVVTNASKSVVWNSQNNAFGNTPGVDLIGNLNVGFPGQYYDIESGTYYNYFRTYDPNTGRYLQSDPIGLDGGLNTYVYAISNPITRTDSFGLKPDFEAPYEVFGDIPPSERQRLICEGAVIVAENAPVTGVVIAVGDLILNPSGEGLVNVVLSAGGPFGKFFKKGADVVRSSRNVPSSGSLKNASGNLDDAAAAARNQPHQREITQHAQQRLNGRDSRVTNESMEASIVNGQRRLDPETGKTVHDLPASQSPTGRGVTTVTNHRGGVVTVIDKGSKFEP